MDVNKESQGDSSVVEYSSCLSHVEDGPDDNYQHSGSSAIDCCDEAADDHCEEEATGLVAVRPRDHGVNHNDDDGSEPFMMIEYPNPHRRAAAASVFRKTLFSDRSNLTFRGIVFIERGFPIQLLKFTLYTYAGIWILFYWVRWMVSSVYIYKQKHSVDCMVLNSITHTHARTKKHQFFDFYVGLVSPPRFFSNGNTMHPFVWQMFGVTKEI
jgi:hypothetical protein